MHRLKNILELGSRTHNVDVYACVCVYMRNFNKWKEFFTEVCSSGLRPLGRAIGAVVRIPLPPPNIMKLYISYFAKLRKLPSNILPLSTAVYKPKWYDGLSIRELSPYKIKEVECIDCDHAHHETCSFLKQYREYLETLDFDEVYHKLNTVSELTNMDLCLLVYEVTSNPCSERGPLVDWFKTHGVEITEFGAAAKS